MAETEAPPGVLTGAAPIFADYPPAQFPVIFADHIWNANLSAAVVKLYFSRIDPSFKSDGTTQSAVFAQIVMPTSNFVLAAIFLESQVRALVKNNTVTQEYVDGLRKAILGEGSDADAK